MHVLAILAAALLAEAPAPAPAPAPSPAPVSVAAGESVVVRIAADGAVSVEGRGPAAAMSDYDRKAVAELVGTPLVEGDMKYPAQPLRAGGKMPPVAAGTIRVTFRDLPGKSPHDGVLTIENGYSKAFRYRALMRRGDKSAPTDVCLVLPNRRGYELWPFQIDRIDLSELRLVPWTPDDGVPCE